MNINNIESYFPTAYKPRVNQIEILQQVTSAINEGYKFVILQAPTGSGKSMFSATLANATQNCSKEWVDLVDSLKIFDKDVDGQYSYAFDAEQEPSWGAMVLTITKTLQNQYSRLFHDVHLLKGKSNYVCTLDNNFDAELAPCSCSTQVFRKCRSNRTCDYLNRRDEVIKSKFGVLNYKSFLCLPDHVKKRSLLICDEASELEDELVDHFSATVDYFKLKYLGVTYNKLLVDNDLNRGYAWLIDIYNKVVDITKDKQKVFAKKNVSQVELNKVRSAVNLQERIGLVLDNWKNCEYVIEIDAEKATFVPLYVNALSNHVFKHADVVILMSATIIDPSTLAKVLGIDKFKYIEAASGFDPKLAPIYCPGKLPLNYGNIDKNLPKVIEQAIDICKGYKNKKGIIHTHSFKITKGLQAKVGKNKRFLFREDGITNEQILDEHFSNSDDTILVSPSLSYGIDLIGKSGEFQVIMKLPYLPLGSKRIKMLADKDKDWYIMKMLVNLMQMCGRIIRSEDDEGDTFILDGQTVDMLKRNWYRLPKHFKDRLK